MRRKQRDTPSSSTKYQTPGGNGGPMQRETNMTAPLSIDIESGGIPGSAGRKGHPSSSRGITDLFITFQNFSPIQKMCVLCLFVLVFSFGVIGGFEAHGDHVEIHRNSLTFHDSTEQSVPTSRPTSREQAQTVNKPNLRGDSDDMTMSGNKAVQQQQPEETSGTIVQDTQPVPVTTQAPAPVIKSKETFPKSSGNDFWQFDTNGFFREIDTSDRVDDLAFFNDERKLATGTYPTHVSERLMKEADEIAAKRAKEIKKGMAWVWGNYEKYAYGRDELKPASGSYEDRWGGHGVTLTDSLDTLWLMGMKDEFYRAIDWIRSSLSFDIDRGDFSTFETNIRDLGGLLSAYDLSGEDILLEKAKDLGDRLYHAYDNSPKGVPHGQINLRTGSGNFIGWAGGGAVLAEVGTMQVEFRYLSRATKDPKYEQKAFEAYPYLRDTSRNGMLPCYIQPSNGNHNGPISFGAMGDSYYEYLLKTWLQDRKNEKDAYLREMYEASVQGMHDQLYRASSSSNKYAYVTDSSGIGKMEHLTCFVPGMLALGAYTSGKNYNQAKRDLETAKALAYTCFKMSDSTPTGLPPEFTEFTGSGMRIPGGGNHFYMLRPEVAESLFILHQLTGNPIYREWGWKMWKAIDNKCKTNYGYGHYTNVGNANMAAEDKMESFFLAETMKYLYLLQEPERKIRLDKYIFNTEAHPTKPVTQFA
eukprot:g1564.t1